MEKSTTLTLITVLLSSASLIETSVCGGNKECSLENKSQSVEQFFDSIMPNTPGEAVTLKDLGHLLTQQLEMVRENVIRKAASKYNVEENLGEVGNQVDARENIEYMENGNENTDGKINSEWKVESRQYPATSYADYYSAAATYPGYNYFSSGTTSTSFNGLDAGLSALAFLAFGVWLFNLLLPQLQGAGLGLPMLRRSYITSPQTSGVSDDSPGILSNLLVNSQDLISNIFKQN